MRSLPLWVLLLAAAGLTACKASVKAGLHTQNEADDADFDQPLSASPAADEGEGFDEEYPDQALLGARHDLMLAGENPQPNCSCLAVTVGFPNNPAFFWHSIAPTISPDNQLVIAFSSEGIACQKETEDSLGASYWGYKQSGDDIVVIIENARFGRPMTTGAIIPRSMGGGSVYVEPLNSGVPYGRPLGGVGQRCRVEMTLGTGERVVPLPPGAASQPPPPPAP